jgi:hypothetical protein
MPYGPMKDKDGKIKRDRHGNIKYDHPNGCPMYGTRPECPPQSPIIYDYIDLNREHWFFVIEFDIGAQERKQKKKYPHWSEKQCRNSRHWQNSVNKHLRDACKVFCSGLGKIFTLCPESRGIHVIRTAKKVGIPIKSRPISTVFKIALIGYPIRQPKGLDLFIKASGF